MGYTHYELYILSCPVLYLGGGVCIVLDVFQVVSVATKQQQLLQDDAYA